MRSAIIFVAYIPYSNRIQKYVNALSEYSKNHDLFISITYSQFSDLFLEALNKANIEYQYVIVTQYCKETSLKEGISLYLKSENTYNNVHFLTTNGINYSNDNFEIAFNSFSNYLSKIESINDFLYNNPLCGSYSDYGYINYGWYFSKDLKNYAISLDDSSNIVHSKMDWSEHYKFEHLPLRTNWYGYFTIKDFIVRSFFTKVDSKKINFLETNLSQIVCRFGFIKHFNVFYRPFAGNKELEKQIIQKWIIDNNLLITDKDLNDYLSSCSSMNLLLKKSYVE